MKQIRQLYQQLLAQGKPVLICPNHLTYVDSYFIMFALNSFWGYLRSMRSLPWNFPKRENVQASFMFRIVCYLAKCLLFPPLSEIDQVNELRARMIDLLRQGQVLMLFPEGQRSQGRVDTESFGYGVGQLIEQCPDVIVLCVYNRADTFTQPTVYPKKHSTITLSAQVLQPQSAHQGLRAARDYARQIIQCLSQMEVAYFDAQS